MPAFTGEILYFLRETLQGLGRHKSLSAATLVSNVATFLVFGVILLVTANVRFVAKQLEERKGIVAFIEEGVSQERIVYLESEIEKLPQVETVTLVSKEEALEGFRKSLGKEEILDALGTNPLPASFEVKLRQKQRSVQELEEVANFIGGLRGIEEVSFGGEWTLSLDRILRTLTIFNIVIGSIVGLAIAFIVANTVRLTVLARKESIEIMKVVGATRRFIRIPFLLEGILHTSVSALVALGMLYLGFRAASHRLPDVAFLSPLLVTLFVAVGLGAGIVGTHFSINEVLREKRD
jgi:cell division transport system permease protein